ncbi:RDD family protein [Sanguibacter sp. 25GB23B1]|uniref:RDD family protein n=1 Tax=unclassified Sanguibacter TaxID=2645534 RepID=UPI0032AFB3FF
MTITTGAPLAPHSTSRAGLDPAPARVPSMSVAPVGRRVAAFAVDLAVTALVVAGVYLATDEVVYAALALVEVPVALCVWEARSGLTVGNALLGVRTVRADGPYAPGIARSTVRGLVVLTGFLVAAVGQWVVVASGAWDRSPLRQGWHDAAARTTMIDVSRRSRSRRAEEDRTAGPGSALEQSRPAFHEPVLSAPEGPTRRSDVSTSISPAGPGALPLAPAVPATPAALAVPAAPGVPAVPPVPARTVTPVPAHGAGFTQALPSWSPPRADVTPDLPAAPAVQPPPAAPPRRAAAVGFLLSFDNGQSFTVHGSGLVGRKPQSAQGERHDDLLAVDDENRSLSKTHLEFGIDEGGFWVTDRGSTNGTSVLTAHGEPLDVLVGMRVHVPGDGSVRVGQRQFTARALTR